MSSFINADLGSDSDSDDNDFDPTLEGGEALSEEENSGDNENADGSRKKKMRKKGTSAKSQKLGGIFLDEEESEKQKAETEAMKNEFQKEKEEHQALVESKKKDDIWADFLKDVGTSKKVASKPGATGAGLGALAKKATIPSKVKPSAKPKKTNISSISSIFDSIESGTFDASSKVEKNSRSFEAPLQNSLMSSIFESVKSSQSDVSQSDSKSEDESGNKMKITKVFDFAGEAVEVTKEIDKDSKEAKEFLKQQSASAESSAQKRPGGLSSIMGVISGKKPKMGTLDKSKMDWEKFVKDEGIKEELQSHNRGKDGYVEKQLFLERSDLRRFEIEREAREKSRKTLNK